MGAVISVVIPTCNRSELVSRAIRSVFSQTLSSFELIVVIDGPDRQTRENLGRIDDPRLRVLALDYAVGGAEARNIGVRAARTSWIAFLDDDDEWFPEKLSVQWEVAKASRKPYPILYSRYIGRRNDGDILMATRLPDEGEDISEYLFVRKGLRFGETGLGTTELFAPRQLFLDIPFEKALREAPGLGLDSARLSSL